MLDLTASVERLERLEQIVADLQGEYAMRYNHAIRLANQIARLENELACMKDSFWRHSPAVNHGFGPEPPLKRILECALGGHYEIEIPPGADVKITHVPHAGFVQMAKPSMTPNHGDSSHG